MRADSAGMRGIISPVEEVALAEPGIMGQVITAMEVAERVCHSRFQGQLFTMAPAAGAAFLAQTLRGPEVSAEEALDPTQLPWLAAERQTQAAVVEVVVFSWTQSQAGLVEMEDQEL